MSLIDDALKRARDEAARQDDLERRAKRRWIPPEPPRGKRRGAVIAAAIAAAAGVLGGAGLWVARRHPSRPPVSPRVENAAPLSAPAPTAPLPQVEVAPPPGTGAKAKSNSAGKGSAPPAEVRELSAPLAASAERPPAAAPPAREGAEPKPAGVPTTPRPASAPSPAGGKPEPASFVRVATLPGGVKIELDGIVYSETNPVALINGRVIAPGGYVGDFQLVRVEESRVELRGGGKTIRISLQ